MRAGDGIADGATVFSFLAMAILFQQKHHIDANALPAGIETLSLTCADRQRSRLAAMLASGRAAAIVLPRGQTLQADDVLISTCGQLLRIHAAAQPLMCVQADNAFELMRITYHLANRHVKAMLSPDAIFFEPDTVLAQMVLRLGGQVSSVTRPFIPEAGAYAAEGEHGHSHGHNHSHGEPVALDDQMGQVGEALSVAAHKRRTDGVK